MGRGQGWRARIAAIHRQEAIFSWRSRCRPGRIGAFTCISDWRPPKQVARLEWFLEKVTELGVNRISLLATARSERSHWRPDRLQRLLVAAMKQSGQFRLPLLDEGEVRPASLYAEYADLPASRLIATCDWGICNPWLPFTIGKNHVVFLIGPEGDFTPEEVREAGEARFQPVLLGPNRLRTETAGVAVCAQIHVLHEKR
jgi:16S rRNA (uracil1498-N3)-methyltransferase